MAHLSLDKNCFLMTELYELTMANGIFYSEDRDVICYFDMFFRRVPDDGGFAIMAGLSKLIEYFIRTSKPRSIACMGCAAIADIKRKCRKSGLKLVRTALARFAARYLRLHGRIASIAPTLADRKPTAKVLRLGKWAF